MSIEILRPVSQPGVFRDDKLGRLELVVLSTLLLADTIRGYPRLTGVV